MITKLPSWMDRPALYWDPELVTTTKEQNSLQPPCVYWDCWCRSGGEGIVTYRDLMATAVLTASHLQSTRLPSMSSSSDEAPIVVVAIPEGPCLPLAILVVHALNASTKAIFVPLEPSEAKEHNRRILLDVQPTLVLAAADTSDYDRLEELLVTPGDNLGDPILVDFQGMVQDIWRDQDDDDCTWWYEFCLGIDDDGSESWTMQQWIHRGIHYLNGNINHSTYAFPSVTDYAQTSHIVYTSGTTGKPKGCVSSMQSLLHYLEVKNKLYGIQCDSRVLLASALAFDPCFSDILATMYARGQLALCPRRRLVNNLSQVLKKLDVTHVLCTPTLWGMIDVERQALGMLRVVALGGEPIPSRIQQKWARQSSMDTTRPRLFATYGVTEACVYQTAGEILLDDRRSIAASGPGQYVGLPFRGLHVRICEESVQDRLLDVRQGQPGEVILYGAQLDNITGYWHRPDLAYKFVAESRDDGTVQHHYRTGDRGILDPEQGSLRIVGRIVGEETMVKVNGVRIELGEIEATVIDEVISSKELDLSPPPIVVSSCVVRVIQGGDQNSTRSEIHAYCVLSDQALIELELPSRDELPKSGILVSGGVLLALLRARCTNSLRVACIPNAFIIVPRLPLSPTGKLDRRRLPSLSEVSPMDHGDCTGILLKDYGRLGEFLAETIRDCLNLQQLQQEMLTTSVTLDMMGGDSLAATRIIRAIYAFHHQVDNNRYLGGDYGQFEGVFDAVHLIRATSLGDYVDMLDRNKVGMHTQGEKEEDKAKSNEVKESSDKPRDPLYDALVRTSTKKQSSIAIALLHAGADPNFGNHGKRLGKVSGGFFYRKFAFHSSPLHLACKHGDEQLVGHLLHVNANCKTPDAAGLYPLHLAASSISGNESTPEEDVRRLRCVIRLLDAGAPLVMRDGNHQTVLHAAARSGHSSILQHVMTVWRDSGREDPQLKVGKKFVNWLDRWYRSPVHWAVINGRLEALKVALDLGCTPTPYKPKSGKRTSVAMEYPLELCNRLYLRDCSDESKRAMGAEMRRLLHDAITDSDRKDQGP